MKDNGSAILSQVSLPVVLLLCLTTSFAVAQAPIQSRKADNKSWTMQDCMSRARQALQQQGYSVNWSGPDAFRGMKGAFSALIMCNATPERMTRVNVIIASNNAATDAENDGLWARMLAPAANYLGGATASGSAGNAQYLGCWKDDQSRVLNFSGGIANDMTNNKCSSICQAKGLPYSATQYGSYCYCGSDYRRLGQLAENACNVGCTGDNSQMCGGSWANSVYSTADQNTVASNDNTYGTYNPTGNLVKFPNGGSARYLGCWKDDASRVLNVSGGNSNDMTNNKCTSACRAKGLSLAGTQYGTYCFCGSDQRRLGQLTEDMCSTPCGGDKSQKCGGSWANSVYALQ